MFLSRLNLTPCFSPFLPGPTKTLFVKGLSEDTTDQTLKDSFESAVAARIVTDRDTGSSKGLVFFIAEILLMLLVISHLSSCGSVTIHTGSRVHSYLNRWLSRWKLSMSDVRQLFLNVELNVMLMD